MTIYDLVTSTELAAYWNELSSGQIPTIGSELFPSKQKLGLDIKYIKGSKGLPVVLNSSAFDVEAIPRKRIGFSKMSGQMPFFKESTYIDEELRQDLNMVMETGNMAYIKSIIENVFDDEMSLLKGAAAQRERMRMMALTTGAIAMASNGQAFTYDYGVPADQKVTVTTSWSDAASDIIGDIKAGQLLVKTKTGVNPTRAICTSTTFGYFRSNTTISKSIKVFTSGVGYVTDNEIKSFFVDTLDLEIVVEDNIYIDEKGITSKYVADDTFTLFPSGVLGNTMFGTTPEQSDLMSGVASASVTIVDTGVAITTSKSIDPVTVETKVSMICLPSFEQADKVYIMDVIA